MREIPIIFRYSTHTMALRRALRVLVVDGYTAEGRAGLTKGGASLASDLYKVMLADSMPAHVDLSTDVHFPSDGGESPVPSDYDAIAWTGCSLSVLDVETDSRVASQVKLARDAFTAGVPQFGSCWAAQIATTAAGGKCGKNPRGREMGFARKIQLNEYGRVHPMFEGKEFVFDAFTSHNDEITHLPPGSQVLCGNAWTGVQAVSVKYAGSEFWAVQYHPEYTLHEMARLTYCRIEVLTKAGFFRNFADGEHHVKQLEALHADPSRSDIAWQLGVDHDVMDRNIRCREVDNWVKHVLKKVHY